MLSASLAVLAIALGPSPSRGASSSADCRHLQSPPTNSAITNDNRSRAGTVAEGVLTVRLVARRAAWRPDGPAGCALAVHAFAEEGRSTRIPGPLIRVLAGTEVRVAVRNALPMTLWLRGLQDRAPGALDSVEIAPGATHEFRFLATTPGAWYYWAGGVAARIPTSDADGQLVGALVVDAASEESKASSGDRVLVLTRWTPTGSPDNEGFQLNAFNGQSWPNTERLRYTVGDSVRWHVINASNGIHEMHLHGFFFRLLKKGFVIESGAGPQPGLSQMRVTSVLRPGEWLSMVWSPDRPGNWLYHCHLLTHMSGAQRLDRFSAATAPEAALNHRDDTGVGNHSMDDMGGLVLGLDVRPAPTRVAAEPINSARQPRMLDIFATMRARAFGERVGYGFVVQNGPIPPPRDSIRIPGAPLILTKGEPVRIAVHNRLAVPISVHWHGIELDSYFDGVGGFSGAGRRIAPMIPPSDSFIVRFTPPRAGTYMYHIHGESGDELASGLYAPLLVLEPGETFDPRTDRVFVFADGGPVVGKPIFINGTAAPDTMEMTVGTTYRLRLIYISANDVYFTTLGGAAGPVMGRPVALDGHDVPTAASIPRPMMFPTGPGHTQDFAFTPTAPGDYTLAVERFVYSTGVGVRTRPATTVPIRVRSP